MEVVRLQDELSAARPASATNSSSTTYVLNGASNGRLTAQLQALNNGSSSSSVGTIARPAASPAGWLNPLGYIGYWFGGQPGRAGDAKAAAAGIIIIKV